MTMVVKQVSYLCSIHYCDPGADYYIYVSKYSAFTAGNDFVMSVNCVDCTMFPSSDDCDGAIAQVSGVTFTGNTCCASAESMHTMGWITEQLTVFGSLSTLLIMIHLTS